MIAAVLLAIAAPANPDCSTSITITNAISAHVSRADEPALGSGRVTTLQVTIGADGTVSNVKVYKSSGLPAADAAAIAAVGASTYTPAMRNCHAVAETILLDEVVRPDYTHFGKDCPTPNVAATVIKQPPVPYPASAWALHASGQAWVRVTIGPDGGLENARIVHSAANMALDQAALDVARASIYAPKLVNCAPTTSDYLFKVTFAPNL